MGVQLDEMLPRWVQMLFYKLYFYSFQFWVLNISKDTKYASLSLSQQSLATVRCVNNPK